jgi:hypothetical protein
VPGLRHEPASFAATVPGHQNHAMGFAAQRFKSFTTSFGDPQGRLRPAKPVHLRLLAVDLGGFDVQCFQRLEFQC